MTFFQVKFEAITRTGYQGDISIDDISIEDGDCPNGAVKIKYDKSNTFHNDEHKLRRYEKRRLHRSG